MHYDAGEAPRRPAQGRRCAAAMLTLAVAAALSAGGSPASAPAAPGVLASSAPTITLTSPATVAGELDLRRVTLTQRAGSIVWSFSTTRPFMLSHFGAGRMPCLRIGPRGVPAQAERLCIEGRGGPHAIFRVPLQAGGPHARWVAATITRPTFESAVVLFRRSDAGLSPGLWDFGMTSVWTGTRSCPTSAPCRDAVPHRGLALWRIDHFTPAGCLARGPSEVFTGPPGGRMIALSFDDGPSPYTARILAVLHRYRVPATFFEVGRQVAADPADARRVRVGASLLGNHTWSHRLLTGANLAGQVGDAQAEIRRVTGYAPCLVRPPYGAASASIVSAIRRMGMLTVQWDVDPRDWALPGTRAIVDNVLAHAHPGAIVLLHDGGGPRSQTVAALGAIVPALIHRGYRLVTVPRLLGLPTVWRYTP